MRAAAAVACALAAGCGVAPSYPCQGQPGGCLEVDVQGDVGPVDTIRLDLSGAVTRSLVSLPSRRPTPLPVVVGILLPDVSGQLRIAGAGLLGNVVVGTGATDVTGLTPGIHFRATLTLAKPGDRDGDGDPDDTDCGPDDPAIHHGTPGDPHPEGPNCCGYSLGKEGADANRSFDADPLCHPGACGDGIDQDCDGADDPCVRDRDCDTFAAAAGQPLGCAATPSVPAGTDCNDCDATVNPLAPEACDGKDNNCNGAADETCASCDLDGDGFQRQDPKSGCPDPKTDKHPGKVDCDDQDAGVFPGSTMTPTKVPSLGAQTCNGQEGGTLACALRGACRAKRPDGTAQDADCDGVARKGCPMVDLDGDGFAAPEDCDDNDPTTFSGAPDRCGDGKAQNCVQDLPCAVDADRDGYDDTVDCSDADPAVHPWAVEKCNGRDDDCDGLVDEGNPDGAGMPMVRNGEVLHCNASGLGECKPTTGDCVCSAARISFLFFDQATRTACPGEDAEVDTGARAAASAPRCYGAPQPRPQSCDPNNPRDEDCDGRVDAPDGKNFPLVGQDCWPAPVGQCRGGKIIGCGSAQPNCFARFGVNPWWICGSGAVCPAAEKCNGLDDDCDGAVPQNERDADGDLWIACGSPHPMYSSGQACEMTLKPGLLGCGDCADGNPQRSPGAKDDCDGVDNDCNPGTADGAADCPGPKPAPICCGQNGCKNPANDLANCNGCGMTCSVANGTPACVNSACTVASCNPPYRDCDNMASNGCETNTMSNALHCGACGASCLSNPVGHACLGGACGCVLGTDCTGTGDTCALGRCACGANPPCNAMTQRCVMGACLLQTGQNCTMNSQCASGVCRMNGRCM